MADAGDECRQIRELCDRAVGDQEDAGTRLVTHERGSLRHYLLAYTQALASPTLGEKFTESS